MGLYGHFSPKRTICWPNSPHVVSLDKGKLLKAVRLQMQEKHQKPTTVKYISKGKNRFRGVKKNLKDSQLKA
jgi:hypothetical protein